MRTAEHGVTLIEIVAAAVIGSVVAGGTMMAFAMAAKLSHASSRSVEAAGFAQQTLERFRNKIACRRGAETNLDTWYDAACVADPPMGSQDDPLPAGAFSNDPGAWRHYQVTPADCDGNGAPGDCVQLTVTVHWNEPD